MKEYSNLCNRLIQVKDITKLSNDEAIAHIGKLIDSSFFTNNIEGIVLL